MKWDPRQHSGRLKRLDSADYRETAWVHWTMTVEDRKTGWLTASMHAAIREAMLHALARYRLICAVYCLMPDHGHFLWGGLHPESDQRLGVRLFRRTWNRLLAIRDPALRLQLQPYDHVLRDEEENPEVFEEVCGYVLDNPVRAGLVAEFSAWPSLGCLAVGYPELDPRSEDFWERFWKIYEKLRGAGDST